MYAQFNRFEIEMTKAQAESASHSGSCDADVAALLEVPKIWRQLKKINSDALAAELADFGCWDDDELENFKDNCARIVWIAAGNICDGATK